MKFYTSVILFAATVTASPVPRIFNLVSSNASDESHNGLYLSTQHVDPLNSKAVFRDVADAAEFYLLEGTVRYNAPNQAPYALALVSGDEVQSEVEIGVSPSSGSTGFSLASDNILSTDNENWGGWLGKFLVSSKELVGIARRTVFCLSSLRWRRRPPWSILSQ